jgi:hypothetical protein
MGVIANDTGEDGFWRSDAQMILTAVICPPATYGVAGDQYLPDQLQEFQGFRCVPCDPGMITAGDQYRAAAYISSRGEVVTVDAAEGGYVDAKACTNKAGWGFYTNVLAGNASREWYVCARQLRVAFALLYYTALTYVHSCFKLFGLFDRVLPLKS